MCGRYAVHFDAKQLGERFLGVTGSAQPSLPPFLDDWHPHYNASPTQRLPVVVSDEDGTRHLDLYQWGLIPSWAKEPSIGARMINARSETAAEKPSFRTSLRKRRCLVPAAGFYEWRKGRGTKQPFLIYPRGGDLIAFAGIWDEWRGPDGPLRSYSILTTDASPTVIAIHDRMPVILSRAGEAEWLEPDLSSEKIADLLRPCPDEFLVAYPVTTRMGNPRFDGPECIEALTAPV